MYDKKNIFSAMFLSILMFSLIIPVHGENRIKNINTFAVYYGDDSVEELEKFDLVILSPLLQEEAIELNKFGVITIGYLSLTTIGGWEPWAKNVSKEMIIGHYEEWGEKIVNVCDQRWREIVLNEAIPYILKKGFKGVFLDNLDMIDKYPFMRNCVIELVKDIREKYPNSIIVVNRGFSVIEDIAPYIDAVLFEGFGTYYNFSTKQYLKWQGNDYKWMINVAEKLKTLSAKYGFIVLALGYADLDNETMLKQYCEYVSNLASKYGFIPYIGNVYLNKVNTLCLPMFQKHSYTEKPTIRIIDYVPYILPMILAIIIVIAVRYWKTKSK